LGDHPEVDAVVAARRLAPLILASREQGERGRHVPPEVVEALAAAGLLQMYLPRSVGGPELPPLTVFRAIEELSKADGSVGWCATIATNISLIMGWLPPEVGRAFCGEPADLRAAGSIRPLGRAHIVHGGYRVEGQWDFASGIDHANRIYCTCIVMQEGKPKLTATGTQQVRAMWLPRDQATILDTWATVGMRGTGSQDFVVDHAFVPASHSCFVADPPCESGPLYRYRPIMVMLNITTVANSLGIARGAIDTLVELAAIRSSTTSTEVLRERPFVQARLGEAEAILNSARAFAIDAFGRLWEELCAGSSNLSLAIAQARLAIVHGMHEAVRAVDMVFHAAGTNAIYSKNPLERHFRDVHVAVQHNAGFHAQYESAGKVLMGLRPSDVGW
jgi:indole-3-acetate monooxygenase